MSAQNKGIIFTVLSAVCFATGGLLIKLNTMSSMSINGLRSFLAFFVFVGYMVYTRHAIRFNWQVLVGVVANSLMNITFIMANKLTTAANAIILQFTLPIYIILLMWVFQKKKPDRVSVLASALSFVGILFFFFLLRLIVPLSEPLQQIACHLLIFGMKYGKQTNVLMRATLGRSIFDTFGLLHMLVAIFESEHPF